MSCPHCYRKMQTDSDYDEESERLKQWYYCSYCDYYEDIPNKE